MLRDQILGKLDHDPLFRWRGENVTRIENLSDIVFALAFGMLVSSSSSPQNYTQLLDYLWQIIPVIAGFSILVLIWNAHFVFFRRYGVADNWIIVLNAGLLLMALFIAYPLRFIFDGLFGYLLGAIAGDWSRMKQTGMDFQASASIVGLFAIGYAVTFFILALMYGHALRKKDVLNLNETELALTKRTVWHYRLDVVTAFVVASLAVLTPIGPFAACLLGASGLFAPVLRWRFPVTNTASQE